MPVAAGKIRWRTATVNGRTITYAVVQRPGEGRVVLVKRPN